MYPFGECFEMRSQKNRRKQKIEFVTPVTSRAMVYSSYIACNRKMISELPYKYITGSTQSVHLEHSSCTVFGGMGLTRQELACCLLGALWLLGSAVAVQPTAVVISKDLLQEESKSVVSGTSSYEKKL